MSAEPIDAAQEQRAKVGQLIRGAREARCWSQADLAKRMDRTQTVISYWESGSREIGICDLILLAEVFEVGVSDLVPCEVSARPRTRLAERAAQRGSEAARDAIHAMALGRIPEAIGLLAEAMRDVRTARIRLEEMTDER
jgi:transcriptional regulator with XRE-family HTH domain